MVQDTLQLTRKGVWVKDLLAMARAVQPLGRDHNWKESNLGTRMEQHTEDSVRNRLIEIFCSKTYILFIHRVQRVRLSFLTLRGKTN